MNLIIDSPAALGAAFAVRFEALAAEAVAARGLVTLAIPGGSVAKHFLPALAGRRLDWPRVHVFWCDERAVPPGSPDSNEGLARALLFDAEPGRRAVLHPLPGAGADLAAAARAAEADLLATCGGTLDAVLLGVGEDGHVASLFPGHPALAEVTRRVLAVDGAPKPPPRRLTLSLPVLCGARAVFLAAFGPEKAPPMREARAGGSALPVARVMAGARELTLLLDPAAAGR